MSRSIGRLHTLGTSPSMTEESLSFPISKLQPSRKAAVSTAPPCRQDYSGKIRTAPLSALDAKAA